MYTLYYSPGRKRDVTFTQGNLLCLPFADKSLDLVVTSGALEYVNLADGLSELARVIAPGGHLLHLPVHPSPIGVLLEIMFRFKSHPPKAVKEQTEKHFRIVHQYHFRAHGDGARNTQTLLLPAGQPGARLLQPVLHFAP